MSLIDTAINIIYIIIPLVTVLYGLKLYFNYKTKVKPKQVTARDNSIDSIISNLPDTLGEFFHTASQAAGIQLQSIQKELLKKGQDPETTTEVSYTTLKRQYDLYVKADNLFNTNPLVSTLDKIGFPIIKSMLPDAIKAAQRLLRGLE